MNINGDYLAEYAAHAQDYTRLQLAEALHRLSKERGNKALREVAVALAKKHDQVCGCNTKLLELIQSEIPDHSIQEWEQILASHTKNREREKVPA